MKRKWRCWFVHGRKLRIARACRGTIRAARTWRQGLLAGGRPSRAVVSWMIRDLAYLAVHCPTYGWHLRREAMRWGDVAARAAVLDSRLTR